MIKTVILAGIEQMVTDLEKNNTLVINNSGSSVFASNKPNVQPYADGVIEIPSGAYDTVIGTNGTVYVLGTGRVELRGIDYVDAERASLSGSGSGGGASDVTKDYVDSRDRTYLEEAKKYADDAVDATKIEFAPIEEIQAILSRKKLE